MSAEVRITGLKEFRQELKALDRELPKALRVAFNGAADLVVQDARPKVPSRSGRARASVKARSTQSRARVVGGGKKAPWYPFLDFGGRVGPNRSVSRPYLSKGRYIYESYFKKRDEFQDTLNRALVDVARQAGFEVD